MSTTPLCTIKVTFPDGRASEFDVPRPEQPFPSILAVAHALHGPFEALKLEAVDAVRAEYRLKRSY